MNPVNAQDYIQKHRPMKWSRSTIADGKWMQDNTLTPLNNNDERLGIYIDKVVEGLNAEIADRSNLTAVVDDHTTAISRIQDDINNVNSSLSDKKDKQTVLTFDGSATKTVKSITQYANGELNVEFEDIALPQEVPNVEIKSKDGSVNVAESTDSQTNTKTFDLSVDSITNIASSDGSINVSSTDGNADLTLPSDVVRDSAYTHIDAATANPLTDGTAAVGVSVKYAREDHVHPSDTTREMVSNKSTVVIGTSDSKYPTDKAVADFVNSSIATNTANYISNSGGPFTSVAQLEAYSGTVTNNDYAFVTGTDSEGNTYYDRYKATVSGPTVSWSLEYRLNNSSFTAAQWAAINSGITATDVSNLANKLNVDGSNATNAGVTAMMKKVSSGTGRLDDNSTYFGDSNDDHTHIVRRPILNLWNYFAPKVDDKIVDKLGSVRSADKPISLENGVPKVCMQR